MRPPASPGVVSKDPLIFNPRSAGGRGAALAEEAKSQLAARGVDVALEPTAGPGGAAVLAERLAKSGAERVLVVGGDGTASEAADGILKSGRSPALGCLPAGTGNAFLMHFGVKSIADAADRIAAGKITEVDAARATWEGGSRHFINVFGVGFAAKVCDTANRRLKWVGAQAYNIAVFPELVRLRSPTTRLVLDGRVIEERFPLVLICNTVYTGTAMKAAPEAKSDDGLLDVVALRKVGRIGLLRLFTKIFSGEHVGHERVLMERAREIRIEPSEPSPLLGDGEVYGETPVTATVLPRALKVLV